MFTSEFIQSSFNSDEPVKDIARRDGFNYQDLSDAWKLHFGESALKARVNRLKGLASKRSHDNGTRKKAVLQETPIPCSVCGESVQVKLVAAWQLDRSKFTCQNCSGDRDCPVCTVRVNGSLGLIRHLGWQRKSNSLEHIAYEDSLIKDPFEGQVEGENYVVCLECGAKETSLGAHLVKHSMNADAYRQKHGADSPIHSAETRRKKSLAARFRADYGKGSLKNVTCPDCGGNWAGSKFLVPGTHDLRCEPCKKIAVEEAKIKEDLKWSLLKEPDDYVTCLDCGYRAESLISHIQSTHPDYRVRYPDSEVVSLNSKIRDKAHLRGVPISDFVRKKMSENAGRWASGLTKDTDGRIARAALKMKGKVSWSRGLSKETDQRLAAAGQAQRAFYKRHPKPHLEISPDLLRKFLSSRGAVLLGKASAQLGHCRATISRECLRHGFETHNHLPAQYECLENIAHVVGFDYKPEWRSWNFCDAITGHRYRFDGFFKELGLVVEFQGHQHYTFPNRYHKTLEDHEDCLRRDRAKRAMIEATPGLTFFEVREGEPFTDESYMRGRLFQAGVLKPGSPD